MPLKENISCVSTDNFFSAVVPFEWNAGFLKDGPGGEW
jgi:hypothetical protein